MQMQGGSKMKDVSVKLLILRLKVQYLLWKIAMPFQVIFKLIERYFVLRKIDKSSQNNWERYLKIQELKAQDELHLQKGNLGVLKAQIIGAFSRVSIVAMFAPYIEANTPVEEMKKREFKENKSTLLTLIKGLEDYKISLPEKIMTELNNWEFDTYSTNEALLEWSERFLSTINSMELVP